MGRKFWLGALSVFVVLEGLMFLVDGVVLSGAYMTVKAWRPDMMSLIRRRCSDTLSRTPEEKGSMWTQFIASKITFTF